VDEAIQATQAVIEQTRRVKEGLLQDLLTKGIGHTRFKQTEIGEIPEEWEVRSVGNSVSDIIDYRGKTPPYTDHGVPVISQEDIQKTGLRPSTKWVTPETADGWVNRGTPAAGDTVFRMERFVGEVVQVPRAQRYIVTRGVLALRAKTEVLVTDFFFWAFVFKKRSGYWDKHGHATTVPRMYKPDLLAAPMPVPPLEEPVRIAAILNQVEASVRTTLEAHDGLRALKAGLLQDLLTGKVRVSA
jgi:type I restriction enzyme S subunit